MEKPSLRRFVAVAASVLALAGCAPWSRHGIDLVAPAKMRVALLPVRAGVVIKRLSDIESPSGAAPSRADEERLIAERMEVVVSSMTDALERRMNASEYLEAVPRRDVERAMAVIGVSASTNPLTALEAEALGRELRVQAVLQVTLSGYGKIKKKWLYYLIGSGFVEGAAQGVAAGLLIHSAWAAVGIAVEEVAQETLTWGGGAYLFNRVFTPVILEGALFSARDGAAVWSETAFSRANRKGLKAYPKEERKRKELRLRVTADDAIEDLVSALEKKARKNRR